jgi:AAA family ATPase
MKLGSVDFDFLVNATSGFSGAETAYLCQEAGFKALEEDINIECIEQRHFESALSVIEPRISLEMLNFYIDFKSNTNLKQL